MSREKTFSGVVYTPDMKSPADGLAIDGKTFADLQGIVQGYVEPYPLRIDGQRVTLCMNEEGAINGSRPNVAAQAVAGFPVFGTVAIIKGSL